MKRAPLVALIIALPAAGWGECPTKEEASLIITRITKTPTAVVEVKPVEAFCACQARTEEGETYFISSDRRYLIEGILVKVPQIKLSKEDYEKLRKRALFTMGTGEPLLVLTNPLCRACTENRGKLAELSKRFKLYFIPVGFEGEEFKAAVDAYCTSKRGEEFFRVPEEFKLCDSGKLRVWSVADTLKKYGITATPAFVFPDGRVAVGVGELLKEIKTEGGAS